MLNYNSGLVKIAISFPISSSISASSSDTMFDMHLVEPSSKL